MNKLLSKKYNKRATKLKTRKRKTKKFNKSHKLRKMNNKLKGGTYSFFLDRIANKYFPITRVQNTETNKFYGYINKLSTPLTETYNLEGKDANYKCIYSVYKYFIENIKPIISHLNKELPPIISHLNKETPKSDSDYISSFEAFQNKNIFYDLYTIIQKYIEPKANTKGNGNNVTYEYLEVIEFIRSLFSLKDSQNINKDEYKNWSEIKKYNSYLVDNNINLHDVYDSIMFLPYHLFRKLYVDLFLLIASIISARIFMNTNKIPTLMVKLVYNNIDNNHIKLTNSKNIKLTKSKNTTSTLPILNIYFNAVGSVNLDSDYDITVSYDVSGIDNIININVASMIYLYYTLYVQSVFDSRVSDEVFDTNIYTIGYDIPDKIITQGADDLFIKINDITIFNISNYELFMINLYYILLKFIEIGDNNIFNINNIDISEIYKQISNNNTATPKTLIELYNTICKPPPTTNKLPNNKSCSIKRDASNQISKHIDTSIRRANMTITPSRRNTPTNIHPINTTRINSNLNIMKYCELTLKELFYSFEAYYSSGTVVHVVGILQSKKIKLFDLTPEYIKCMSFLSIIENFADLLRVYIKYKDSNHDDIYYKLSKYIARIYHAYYLYQNYNNVKTNTDTNIEHYGNYNYIMLLKSFKPDITLNTDYKFKSNTNQDTDSHPLNKLLANITINTDTSIATVNTDNYPPSVFINDLLKVIINLSISFNNNQNNVPVSAFINSKLNQ